MKLEVKLGPKRARKLHLLPQARNLRRAGLTFREISATLSISLRTAWLWTKDVPQGDIFHEG